MLLPQKTSMMGSFPGIQQHQSYGLPAPEPSYGLFHAAGYQQPNLPRQKNQASLRLQHHDTMSLPTAVTKPRKEPVQKSRKRAPPVMKSFSPGQRLKVSRKAGLRKSFLPMDNGRVMGRNPNRVFNRKFLSDSREYNLKKDQSLEDSGIKKAQWGRQKEGKVSWI